MQLVERFWTVVTAVVNFVTLDPFAHSIHSQTPLQNALQDKVDSVLTNYGSSSSGPIFEPPGTISNSGFFCDYSAMVGWEPCSTPTDRTCWLRKIDGSERPFTVYTDYENFKPKGVERYYELNVTDSWWDADGMPFDQAKLFNNTYPGPWIEACWGDRIIINVTNWLHWNGTSVHWHGIRQNITMQADGVNGVSQCPIPFGHSFVYNFSATQYGSSWYHSHYSVQYADGTTGPMTLHGPASAAYDEAISPPLIMTDWGHESAFVAVYNESLKDADILLNGRGNITKFTKAKNTTVIQPPYSITFEELKIGKWAKKYLLRIINTSFDTTFLFTIDNHQFSVVETDFVPVHPYTTNSILVGIGQRYDIIVEALPLKYKDGDLPKDGNYWIRTLVVEFCSGGMKHPLLRKHGSYDEVGILRYNSSSTADPGTSRWPDISKAPKCQDESLELDKHLHPVVPWKVGPPSNVLPPSPGQDFDLQYNATPTYYPLAQWHLGAIVDGNLAAPLRVDYSNITFLNLNNTGGWIDTMRITPEEFDYKDGKTHWVYLVISSNQSGSHPIHLHGHDFAILEAKKGPYDPNKLNLKHDNPPRRDVVLIPTHRESGEGYVVIAFKADNPGAWLVHCHIAFHISGGLGFQILEDRKNAASIWPATQTAVTSAQSLCNEWNNWATSTVNYYPQPECTSGVEDCFQNDSGV